MSKQADSRAFNTGGAGALSGRYRKPHLAPGGAAMPIDRAKNRLRPNRDQDTDRRLGCYEANRGTIARGRWGESGMAFDGGPMPDGVNVPVTGTSIFDPVLCELVYRWFCPPGGTVLDPFAGGSVRGIVAAKLGLEYVGVDLSARQIAANEAQAEGICGDGLRPKWIVGDSANLAALAAGVEADLVFSCPPYFDLEVYSDTPGELSQMAWPEFLAAYRAIIAQAVAQLKENRFACFVVGDVRDKQGFYLNFPGETVAAFQAAGARLYNEAVLVTAVGSLPIRIGAQFTSGRKLGKTHQNVLVFYKGDPRRIKQEFPQEIEMGEPGAESDQSPESP